jgi:hypothetical protein
MSETELTISGGLFYFMVKASLNISQIEVLSLTNQGYDIYRFYLGKVGRVMNRPWGRKESKPSWGIFFSGSGTWVWKDFATEETGNAIKFVEKKFSLSHKEALQKIAFDFGLGNVENVSSVSPITWEAPKIEKSRVKIRFSYQPFRKEHHQFWNAVGVMEADCLRYNCYAVKDYIIGNRRGYVKDGDVVFAYYAPEEDAVKLYFPNRAKEDRFRNNGSFNYLWNYANVSSCKQLIIQKSVKDMIVTGMITPCVIAVQSESVQIFDEATIKKITDISPTPWIWYGSDTDGVEKCKKITAMNGWNYINTPKNLLPEINDVYGYVKKFGLKSLEAFMASKNLIFNG